jgi:hypothetical protein
MKKTPEAFKQAFSSYEANFDFTKSLALTEFQKATCTIKDRD